MRPEQSGINSSCEWNEEAFRTFVLSYMRCCAVVIATSFFDLLDSYRGKESQECVLKIANDRNETLKADLVLIIHSSLAEYNVSARENNCIHKRLNALQS